MGFHLMLVFPTEFGLTLGFMASAALAMLMTTTHVGKMVLLFAVNALLTISRAPLVGVFRLTITTTILVSGLRSVF